MVPDEQTMVPQTIRVLVHCLQDVMIATALMLISRDGQLSNVKGQCG